MNDFDSQFTQPEHFLLHISDTHLVSDREALYGGVDCDENLSLLFQGLIHTNIRPEAIIFTGDLTDTGDSEAYTRLRHLVEPAATELGAEVIWLMGNHDDRAAFRSTLLGEEPNLEPIDRVFDINGLRVIAIDTSVPGEHYGDLTDAQLNWLAKELSIPAPDGTILALHHPPIPCPLGLMALVELREQHRLAAVLGGSDVRGIIGGHLHYSTHSTFAGIPVSVASATCYTQDLRVEYPGVRAQNGGQSYNLVHVYADRIVHSSVPLGEFPTMYEVQNERLAAFLSLSIDEQITALRASA